MATKKVAQLTFEYNALAPKITGIAGSISLTSIQNVETRSFQQTYYYGDDYQGGSYTETITHYYYKGANYYTNSGAAYSARRREVEDNISRLESRIRSIDSVLGAIRALKGEVATSLGELKADKASLEALKGIFSEINGLKNQAFNSLNSANIKGTFNKVPAKSMYEAAQGFNSLSQTFNNTGDIDSLSSELQNLIQTDERLKTNLSTKESNIVSLIKPGFERQLAAQRSLL